MPAQLPLKRTPPTPTYPTRRALAFAVGAVLGATTLLGCGVDPGELEAQRSQLMPMDAGTQADAGQPNPTDFMAGGIAEYPPDLPDAGQ